MYICICVCIWMYIYICIYVKYTYIKHIYQKRTRHGAQGGHLEPRTRNPEPQTPRTRDPIRYTLQPESRTLDPKP